MKILIYVPPLNMYIQEIAKIPKQQLHLMQESGWRVFTSCTIVLYQDTETKQQWTLRVHLKLLTKCTTTQLCVQ